MPLLTGRSLGGPYFRTPGNRSVLQYNLPLLFKLHNIWQVMGVITRKDIAEANAKLALGRKANLGLTTPSDRLVRHGSLPFIPYGAYDPTVGYSASRCPIRLCSYPHLQPKHPLRSLGSASLLAAFLRRLQERRQPGGCTLPGLCLPACQGAGGSAATNTHAPHHPAKTAGAGSRLGNDVRRGAAPL